MKKLILNFFLNLQFIFKPSWWVMNEPFNKDMDDIMNFLIDKYEFTNINEYTAYLGNYKIWIANRPYACMVLRTELHSNCRASRVVIKKGLDKLCVKGIPKNTHLLELRKQIVK